MTTMPWGDALTNIADIVARVLTDDLTTLSENSRWELSWLLRGTNAAAARVAEFESAIAPALAPEEPALSPEDRRVEETFHHVGAIWVLSKLINDRQGRYTRLPQRLSDAGFVWLDELDAASDAELLCIDRVGQRSLGVLREVLDVYFWRGEPAASRSLWDGIIDRLQRASEYKYLRDPERIRIAEGLAFARDVVERDGAPLADTAAPRLAVQ